MRSLDGVRLALLAAVAAVGVALMPGFPYAGDPFGPHEEARSILVDGTLSIPAAHVFGEPGRRRLPAACAWAAVTGLVWAKVSFISMVPMVAVALGARLRPLRLLRLARRALPALVPVAALALVDTVKFGAPWLTGY